MNVDCSRSLFFLKISEIERFALRIAILDESQNYLGSGGGGGGGVGIFDTHSRWLAVTQALDIGDVTEK